MKKPTMLLALVSFICLCQVNAQRLVQGTVLDGSGVPLIGVNIESNTGRAGAVSDIEGRYSIQTFAGDSILTFSYVGFFNNEVPINSRETIDVVMTEESTTLDEVIIVAFGTSTRRKLISAVESVDKEVYEGAAKATPLQALQGRLAGVNIIQSSGAVGSAMNVLIRGQTSINGSNQPLYVIDGTITDTYTGYDFNGPGTDKMVGLDPNNIASVEVLKDGAATAMYGARGANGVILITTRQGEFNTKPKVDLSYQVGFTQPTVELDVMTGPEYAGAWNQAVEAVDGPDFLLYPDPDSVPNTNWWDVLTRTAIFHDVHASVSGGSASTNYFLGAGYRSEEDYFITKGMKRYALQAKVNQVISDKWQIGLNINLSHIDRSRFLEGGDISGTPTWGSASFPPTEVPFDENGEPTLTFGWNPYLELTELDFQDALTQMRASVFVQYSPVPELVLKSELNPEFSLLQEEDFASDRTRLAADRGGFGFVATHTDQNYLWTNTASWTFNPASRHELTLLGGSQLQWKSYSYLEGWGNGFASRQLKDLASAGTTVGYSEVESYRFAGFFTRANYAFSNKLFASASLRYDGSSRFGKKSQWGLFPALSVGWMISQEEFMKGIGVIDYLKLSGSIGKTGNAEIGNFDGRYLLSYRYSYQQQPAVTIPTRLGNDELTWETTIQYNISASFGFFQDRLNGKVSYFIKDTDGLLFYKPVALSNGIEDITGNTGAIRNEGIEFEIGTSWQALPDFRIEFGLNGAFIDNRFTRLPDVDGNGTGNDDIILPGQIFRVGESISTYYLVQYDGVDSDNGDALFYNAETGTSTNSYPSGGSRLIKGSAMARFTGGFYLDMKFKGFFASAVLQTGLGHHIYSDRIFLDDGFLTGFNQSRRQLNSWTPENTNTNIPEARWGEINGSQISTRWLEKGDYLRLKQVQVGYQFSNFGNRSKALTVYAAGQNLWTLTSAYNIDPEVSRVSVDEPFGAVNLNSPSLGRSLSFGIKLEL